MSSTTGGTEPPRSRSCYGGALWEPGASRRRTREAGHPSPWRVGGWASSGARPLRGRVLRRHPDGQRRARRRRGSVTQPAALLPYGELVDVVSRGSSGWW